MIESITALFSSLSSATSTAKALRQLVRRHKGNSRALLEEIKENLRLCWMVVELDTDPMRVIPHLSTAEYDRILRTDFDFNSLRHRRIQGTPELAGSDLKYFIGKETEDLIENIYDKVKTLQRVYEIERDNPKIRWRRRVINLLKRMLLLMMHLRRR